MKKIIKANFLIIIVLALAFTLRCIAMVQLTPSYNIDSDDMAFIESGYYFRETGKITMHSGVVSAKNMPGMSVIIGAFVLVFGNQTNAFWIMIKLFWILMGCASIFGVYKIIKLYANQVVAAAMCLFFLIPDFIWMDNLILTETPYMLCNIFLIYASLQLGKTFKQKYFWYVLLFYILGIMIRPTIALYPLILFVYLLFKKYDFKTLLKQGGIAAAVLLVLLVPWWYRNYKVFDKFIPLTYGTGNPLLLGTYQGYEFPTDEELDYNGELYNQLSDEVKKSVDGKEENTSKKQLAAFEYDEAKAKFRMKKWFEKSPKNIIISYVLYKPKGLIYCSFYWKEIFNISLAKILAIRKIEIYIFGLLTALSVIFRKRWKEEMLVVGAYLYQVALYSYTFSFERYGQVLIFFRYIIIGWMSYQIFMDMREYIKKGKQKIKLINKPEIKDGDESNG